MMRIPLAEETGLMIPLGEWIVREVCRQAGAWQLERAPQIRIAVNLSATQFRHPNLVEIIRSALEVQKLDARCLEAELTESSVMTNPEESAVILRQLRKMGVTVAVDDFGTGYSSLSYLRRFPIDKLKIDRSFVRDLATSRTDESIVRVIIALAHSVGLQVVAEGVETEEQLRCVSQLGCVSGRAFIAVSRSPRPASATCSRSNAPARAPGRSPLWCARPSDSIPSPAPAVLSPDPRAVKDLLQAASDERLTPLADLCNWVFRLAAAQGHRATLRMIESQQRERVEWSCEAGTNANTRLYVQRVPLNAVEARGAYQLAQSFCRGARRALSDPEYTARSGSRRSG